MIEVYKIMTGLNEVDRENLFPAAESTRSGGHRFKVGGGMVAQ